MITSCMYFEEQIRKVLIVKSELYPQVIDTRLEIVKKEFLANHMACDILAIKGIFEVVAAINIALEAVDYEGVILLGCLLKEEQFYYWEAVYSGLIKGISEINLHYNIPIGF